MSHGGRREGAGRKRLAPGDGEVRTEQRRAKEMEEAIDARYEGLGEDFEALTRLFLRKTEQFVGSAAKNLIQKYAYDEDVAKDALNILKTPPRKMLHEDALQMLLRVDLSKHQYQILRSMVNNAANIKNLIPSYDIVRAQKAIAMPQNPPENYSEQKAEVKMQDLLDHTCRRAVLSNEDFIKTNFAHIVGEVNCVFTMTYGGDGAGQQQIYQQRHVSEANKGKKDESLFAAVINPLMLKSENGELLWDNSCKQSHMFVRPFLLEYQKETKEYVQMIFHYIDDQIANLTPVVIDLSESAQLKIKFEMICSLIDGKVFCDIVDLPFTSCPICGVDHHGLSHEHYAQQVNNFLALPGHLRYCVQSCHARINMATLLIRIECKRAALLAKNNARTAIPQPSDDALRAIARNAGNARKQEVIEEFRQNDLHLTQMITGNMAREMLGARRDLTARILHIDPRIIERFRIILICINTTQYKLNREAFKRYCAETRNLYLQLYPWYAITPTLHKILEHSADCEEELDLCLGILSEGGAENQHRIRKLIRRFRARKTSRTANLTDVFNRCLHLSDPVLSTKYSAHLEKFRRARREHESMELPQTAKDLLNIPRPPRVRRRRLGRNVQPVIVEQQQDPEQEVPIENMDIDEEELAILQDEDNSSEDEAEWLGDDFLDE